MSDLLWRYMEERLQQKGYLPIVIRNGPVITISREAGCSANPIAKLLLHQIKMKNPDKEHQSWKIINKEIVKLAADELEVDPLRIEYVFKAEEKNLLDEMLAALSNRYYKNDTKVRKTVMKVIKSYIDDGYVIMVGRGGVAFTREKKNAINIMLHAPIEWRINHICNKYGVAPDKAREMIQTTDKERRLLVEHFYGTKTDFTIYDAVFNTSMLTLEQISQAIYTLAEGKKLI